jgi:hypothetical protein
MGRAIPLLPTGRTEPQCLYKGALYLFLPLCKESVVEVDRDAKNVAKTIHSVQINYFSLHFVNEGMLRM